MSENIKGIRHLKNKTIPFGKKQAFYASIFISLLINILLFLGLLFGGSRRMDVDMQWNEYISFFFWHLGSNITLFYFLFRFNFRAIKKKQFTGSRAIYVFLGTIFICIVASPVFSGMQWILLGGEKNNDSFIKFASFNMCEDLVVAVIVIMTSRIMNLYLKREQTILANQKLMQENIRVKYESLKNQLNPHFLFNSLNTLNGLVGVDDDKAHEYIDNLSSVFRYTLHSKSVCTLEQEMEFVNAYFSLLQIRYGESLRLCTDIDTKYLKYEIIPVSLQLLVENTVKHNIVSHSDPLTIFIEFPSDNTVVVRNKINRKRDASGGGVGLANLAERYLMMFGRTIDINESDGEFSVSLPLIKRLPL